MLIGDISRTAWHEAGHALVAVDVGVGVYDARLLDDGGGHVDGVTANVGLSDLLAYYAAGAVAEAIASNAAVEAIDWRCGRFDFDLDQSINAMEAAGLRHQAAAFKAACQRAATLLRPRMSDVEDLALELDIRGRMSGVQVRRVLARREEEALRVEHDEAKAVRASPLGRARETGNFEAWKRAGRPGQSLHNLEPWNAGVRVPNGTGGWRVLFTPPFPIH